MAVKIRKWLPESSSSVKCDGVILIPVLWLAENISRNNLQITMSLDGLVKSERLSDRILHDIIMDVSTNTFKPDGAILWRYLIEQREWRGIRCNPTKRSKGNLLNINVYVGGKVRGGLPLNSPYVDDVNGVDPIAEYNFNKLHCDYFYGKFPIRLKTMCPVCGESSLTTVEVVGENRKSTSASPNANLSSRFAMGINLLDK